MKLAEALVERASLQKKIESLKKRLVRNSKVQDGEKPNEDPTILITELEEDLKILENLISKINLVNCKTFIDGVSLTEMIAKRDVLKLKITILQEFLESASSIIDRYSNTEIKIKSTINVSSFQKQIDKTSKEIRLIDTKIQETNWITELM